MEPALQKTSIRLGNLGGEPSFGSVAEDRFQPTESLFLYGQSQIPARTGFFMWEAVTVSVFTRETSKDWDAD